MIVELFAVVGLMFILYHVYKFSRWVYDNYPAVRRLVALTSFYVNTDRKKKVKDIIDEAGLRRVEK